MVHLPLLSICLPTWMKTGVNWQATPSKYPTETASWTHQGCHLLHPGEDITLLLDRSRLNTSKPLPDFSNCAHTPWTTPANHTAKAEKPGCVVVYPRRTPHSATEQHGTCQWDFVLLRAAISSSHTSQCLKGTELQSPKAASLAVLPAVLPTVQQALWSPWSALGQSNCSSDICGTVLILPVNFFSLSSTFVPTQKVWPHCRTSEQGEMKQSSPPPTQV